MRLDGGMDSGPAVDLGFSEDLGSGVDLRPAPRPLAGVTRHGHRPLAPHMPTSVPGDPSFGHPKREVPHPWVTSIVG